MTGRAVPEWRGRTPDSKVPDHVRLRIFRNANGVCHISGRKIAAGEAWELEHIVALCNGGLHREAARVTARRKGVRIWFPHISLCTDNAAMIAGLAWRLRPLAPEQALRLNAQASLPL